MIGVCKQSLKIAPGSIKWVWIEWPKREIGTATISSAAWTLPSNLAQSDTDIDGLRTGVLLDATGATECSSGWIGVAITTNAGETLQTRLGVSVTREGH